MTYRKRKGTDTWHWCANCSNWPTTNFDTVTTTGKDRPKTGELDNECLAKEKANNCRQA